MTRIEWICVVIAAVISLIAFGVVIYDRYKTWRIMRSLNEMVEAAIEGTFTERVFDESRQAALEAKMRRYLMISELSAKTLATEKDKIKELIADISHQTKTPIANVRLYAELLKEQNLPAESYDLVSALDGQAEKLSFLITSLVKLSRLETGIIALHPARRAVAPMLEQSVADFQTKAAEKDIRLEIVTESTESVIRARSALEEKSVVEAGTALRAEAVFDEKWTLEAVGNIVDNAIKYTPRGGKVTLRIVLYEMFCCIEVEDTGMGISEAEQAKIFKRFYRSAKVSQSEGVGIGLYLARQIVSEEDGYIKVKSKQGAGSVFGIYLPR